MAKNYDVVIVGAGHAGLTVGCYLLKAGLSVCILEHLPYVGGGVVSLEAAAPGFKTDPCAVWHGILQANPLILNDELNLFSKYGMEYVPAPSKQNTVLFDDNEYITLSHSVDDTCESIAKFSQKDAEAYRKFYEWWSPAVDFMLGGMYNPAVPYSAFASLCEQSEMGKSIWRALHQSADDLVSDWFESTEVKALLTRYTTEALLSPRTKGTGFAVFIMCGLTHKYPATLPKGGSGSLSLAMERCILAQGGEIKCNAEVKKIKVVGGEAKSVILKSGEEIVAKKAVVSNLHVKQLFPDMVGEDNLPPDFVRQVKGTSLSDFGCMNQQLALNEAPNFIAGDDVNNSFFVEFGPRDYEKYLRSFDELCYGYPVFDVPLVVCQTRFDPTRAPAGKHTLYLYSYAPYKLKEGGVERWKDIGQEIADKILETLRKQTTNMGDENIIGRFIETPPDIERRTKSMIGSDFCHLGTYVDQIIGARPCMGWSGRTPINNLYMCGPSVHPGCGVTGGGRAQVQPVMEDLGIDFFQVIK